MADIDENTKYNNLTTVIQFSASRSQVIKLIKNDTYHRIALISLKKPVHRLHPDTLCYRAGKLHR